MPTHIEIMTARIDPMTPQAPFTPHIQAVRRSEVPAEEADADRKTGAHQKRERPDERRAIAT